MAKAKKHSQRKHALLSASGSDRWLNCTASVRLEAGFPDSSSEYAKEGTLAHEFADFYLRWKNDEITEGRYTEAVEMLERNEFYSSEMHEFVAVYTTYVLEAFTDALLFTGGAKLMIEEKLDFSEFVPDGFGTGDATIIGDGVLEVVDLKYGRGVAVSAEDNSQLKLYGLGALAEHGLAYDIHTVKLTIVQPRLYSISSWEISVEELYKWANEVVKPTAEIAIKGEGTPVAGSHCKWCKAKAKCRAFANTANVLAADDFKEPDLLTDDEIIAMFELMPVVAQYLQAISSYLHEKAKQGKKFKGYKLVQTVGRRKWGNEDEVKKTMQIAGFELDKYTNTKLKGIKDIADLVTVDFYEAHLKKLIIRPQGSPAFVKEDDPRPAIGLEQAIKDFS